MLELARRELQRDWDSRKSEKSFGEVVDWVAQMRAADRARPDDPRPLRDYLNTDLLIIDDMGMKELGRPGGEALLEIVMRRHGLRSTLMTTNRPLDDWGKLLGDNAAASAVLDRLLGGAEIIVIKGQSYRLKDTACTPDTETVSVPPTTP